MKKRSVLMTVLAMILVAVISVGSTLAYLTATDKEVVNTFHFADMTVTMTEPTPSAVPSGVVVSPHPSDGGFDYDNILPDSALGKNPQISTKTDVDAWLFVKVSGADELIKPCLDANGNAGTDAIPLSYGWKNANSKEYPVNSTTSNGLYYREIKVGSTESFNSEEGTYGPFNVFEYVKVADKDIITVQENGKTVTKVVETENGTTKETIIDLNQIKIEVFEIQMADIDLAEATRQAEAHFAKTAAADTNSGEQTAA